MSVEHLDQLWRRQYHSRRYMEFLSESELKQRIKDIFTNMLVLTEDGKIGLVPPGTLGHYLMESFTHAIEELAIRHGSFPGGFADGFIKGAQIPNPHKPIAKKAAELAKQKRLQPGKYFAKYGKLVFLRPAFEDGIIRICPATAYDDPSLNPAIRDNELEITIEALPTETKLTVVKSRNVAEGVPIHATSNIKITQKSATNYYVYCLSANLAPRLFLDFEADACLLITNPDRFFEMILGAFEKAMPTWAGAVLQVSYVDPLRTKTTEHDVFASKHFRYLYQDEVRIIWLPQGAMNELHPVHLELGSLSSCCELISLE